MRNAGNQFFPAAFLPLSLLNGLLQPFCHVVEVLAYRQELVLFCVGDAIRQVAVPNLVHAGSQNVQWLFDFPEHKFREKPVSDQNCRHDQHRQHHDQIFYDDFIPRAFLHRCKKGNVNGIRLIIYRNRLYIDISAGQGMQRHICQFFLSVPHGTDLHIPFINLQLNALGLDILFHRLIQRRI